MQSLSLSVLQVKRSRPPGTRGPAPIVCLYGTQFLVWILGVFTCPVYLMETLGSSIGKQEKGSMTESWVESVPDVCCAV